MTRALMILLLLASAQVYEETAGLTVGDVVTRTKKVGSGFYCAPAYNGNRHAIDLLSHQVACVPSPGTCSCEGSSGVKVA